MEMRKLVTRLSILSLVAILLMLTLFNHNIEKSTEAELQSYLEEIRANAIFILNNELDQFSAYLSCEARALNFLVEPTEQQLLDELANYPKLPSMARSNLMLVNGTVLSSIDRAITKHAPEPYEDTLTRQAGGISQPRESQSLGRMLVEISTPLYLNGQYSGVLIGSYDIESFESLFASHFLDGTCSISLATSNGSMIARSGLTEIPKDLSENIFDYYFRHDVRFLKGTPQQLKDDLASGKSGYMVYENQGITRYMTYAPVGINDWYIAAVATGHTLAARSATVKVYAFRLALGVFLVVVLLSLSILIMRAREQRSARRALERMASTDALTHLCNKYATEQAIRHFLEGEGELGCHAFLMIDIDGFKHVNDRLGHAKGDAVLANLGQSLRTIFRENDIIGRVGGDEFVVFIKNCSSRELASRKADEVRAALHREHRSTDDRDTVVHTAASVGIALYPQDGTTFDELYHNADVALYTSKGAGKNQYAFFSEAKST